MNKEYINNAKNEKSQWIAVYPNNSEFSEKLKDIIGSLHDKIQCKLIYNYGTQFQNAKLLIVENEIRNNFQTAFCYQHGNFFL